MPILTLSIGKILHKPTLNAQVFNFAVFLKIQENLQFYSPSGAVVLLNFICVFVTAAMTGL